MVKFVVFYNNELLKTYELDEPVISIGRLPENTISIANMGVSRRHVKIEEDADRAFVLSDLNSLNGTFVNGKKVKKVQLRTGDKITIGKYTILYEAISNARSAEQEYIPAAPDKEEQQDFSGAVDFSYVHRTTEPRMRAIPDRQVAAQPVDMLQEEQPSATSTAVLIETNKHVVYKIDKRYMTMGSSDEDDIFISGFMVGPNHVALDVQNDGIYINSTKIMGKFKINGKPQRNYLLQHKDRIEVGSSTFRFMENG